MNSWTIAHWDIGGGGRAEGWVGSDFLTAIAGRVSGQRFAGLGRVQEKWPVDNSDIGLYKKMKFMWSLISIIMRPALC